MSQQDGLKSKQKQIKFSVKCKATAWPVGDLRLQKVKGVFYKLSYVLGYSLMMFSRKKNLFLPGGWAINHCTWALITDLWYLVLGSFWPFACPIITFYPLFACPYASASLHFSLPLSSSTSQSFGCFCVLPRGAYQQRKIFTSKPRTKCRETLKTLIQNVVRLGGNGTVW